MDERLVQWVLLKERKYLQSRLGFTLKRKLAENYTTDYGRIDFAYETNGEIVVVELETAIDNMSKFNYCCEQVKRYKSINFSTDKRILFVILFDEDNTPQRFKNLLDDFAKKVGIILKTYSILDVQELYKKCLEELKKTTGISLGPPVAMDVVYLRWLNRVIKPFYDAKVDKMLFSDVRSLFSSSTNFNVYLNLAKQFELIEGRKENSHRLFILTEYGKRFRDEYTADIFSSGKMPDLSLGQKRILLEILTNGNFTKVKVNIYYFLRFVHLTEGSWVPKSGTPEDREKLEFVNFLFGTNYRWESAKDLLNFTCNQCEELELVERTKIENSDYDRVILTTLGSRVLGWLELYLHLKREQIQIPLQI